MSLQNENSLVTAIHKNVSFALYRLPEQSKPRWMGQNKPCTTEVTALPAVDGFLLYPFKEAGAQPVFIKAEHSGSLPSTDFDAFVESCTKCKSQNRRKSLTINQTDYLAALTRAMIKMHPSGIDKFIYSRIEQVEPLEPALIPRLYSMLLKHYPKAMVYLVNHPVSGLWMGATPEVLLRKENRKILTHSLAGSQRASASGKYNWGAKEKEEQDYVTRYIEDLIQNFNFKYTKKGPFTIEAGPVAHLKTTFEINLNQDTDLWDLIIQLHPTPAVCGLPKSEAEKFILNTEHHDREYYTGFLGPISKTGDFTFYVNLRCMKVDSAGMYLYAGGGITKMSDPKLEWEETQIKISTLKDIIEKVRCGN